MKQEEHKKALKALKSINNLRLSSKTERNGNHSRTEYKHQLIPMGDYTLIVSGSIENYSSKNYMETSRNLVISIHDSNNEDLKFTRKQHEQYKKEVIRLITA